MKIITPPSRPKTCEVNPNEPKAGCSTTDPNSGANNMECSNPNTRVKKDPNIKIQPNDALMRSFKYALEILIVFFCKFFRPQRMLCRSRMPLSIPASTKKSRKEEVLAEDAPVVSGREERMLNLTSRHLPLPI